MIYPVIANIQLAAGVAKTAIRLTTVASRRARIVRVKIVDQSVTATDVAIACRITRAAGTEGSGTAYTPPLEFGSASGTVLSTVKINYTTEGTVGTPDVLDTLACPTGSFVDVVYDGPEDYKISCAPSSNISVILQSASARAVDILVAVWIRED